MNKLRDRVAVVGIGETEYVQKSGRRLREIIIEAVHNALDDAKLTPNDIDGVVGGYTGAQLFNHSVVSSCRPCYYLRDGGCCTGILYHYLWIDNEGAG